MNKAITYDTNLRMLKTDESIIIYLWMNNYTKKIYI